jgi:thioredoxin 1
MLISASRPDNDEICQQKIVMAKISYLKIVVPVLLILCISGTPKKTGSQDNGLTIEEYFKKVQVKDTAVLVYFYADWCVPCIKLKPVMEELEKENPQAKIIKLDVDPNPQIAIHFEINTLPLFILYKNGKRVWSNNTYMNKPALQEKLKLYR